MFLFCAFHRSSRPARGASGGVWLQGGIGERGFGWRQPDLREAVVLRSEGPRGSSSEGADAVSGSRGSRPVVQGPYRRPGSARLPGASPGSGVPSVLSGADLGPVLRLVGSSPGCGFDFEVDYRERSARKRLRRSGGSPPSSTEARDQGPKPPRCEARPTLRGDGLPACFPPGLAAGADRASRPLFSRGRAKRQASTRARHGLRGFWRVCARPGRRFATKADLR